MTEPRFTRRPVDGPITQAFGEAAGGYPHRGVDFGVAVGTPVYAPCAGKVVNFTNSFTQWNGATVRSFGNGVCIEMGGGWWTLLAHLSQVIVNVGDEVVAGQVVGYSGNTGVSTGPHLHWQLCDSPAFPIDFNQSRDPLACIVAEEEEDMTDAQRGLLGIANHPDYTVTVTSHDALVAAGLTLPLPPLPGDGGLGDMNALRLREKAISYLAISDAAEAAYKVLQ